MLIIDKLLLYDDVDDEVLHSFHEMSLANLIFYAMKEGACSEQSSRMTAMDAASKNAGNYLPVWVQLTINLYAKIHSPVRSFLPQ